ncbi:MAG TPA: hypothetical protein VFK42_03455 [Acidimicrobiales bacterium]|nr:hypothetical protein [Acidimicrobiales bacterium]
MRDRVRGLAADVGVAAILAAVTVVLLWDSLRPGRTLVPADVLTAVTPYRLLSGGSHPQNAVVSDAAIQFFPWLHWLGSALRSGGGAGPFGLPGWNPLLLGGLPANPNGFVSVWYPAFWLVRFLDPFDAYGVFVALHLWWAALGMYVLCRCVGVRRRSCALVVAASTLLAGTWLHWSLHLVHLVGMVWLPWALVCVERLVVRPRLSRVVPLAIVIGLWWLGGNPQYAYFGMLATGACALGRMVQLRSFVRPALASAGALAIGALLAAPVLVPSWRIGSSILRVHEPVSSTASNVETPDHLVRLVVPDARGNYADDTLFRTNTEYQMDSPFVGVAVLVLVGAGVAARRRDRSRATEPAPWLLAGIGVAVVLLSVWGLPHHALHALLPGYDRFRVGARWLSVLPVCALPLAALGLDALVDGDRRARWGALGVAAAAGAVVLAWWIWQSSVRGAPHDYFGVRAAVAGALLVASAAAAWLAMRRPRIAVAVVAACVAFELAFHVPRWYPSVVERSAYPSVSVSRLASARDGRVLRAGRGKSLVSTFTADVPMAYGIADAQGQTVLFPRDYDRYLRSIDDYGDWAAATNVAPDVLRPARLTSPLLDLLDVRTIVAESNVRGIPPSLPVLDATGEPRVYANPGAVAAVVVRRAVPSTVPAMWSSLAQLRDVSSVAHVVGLTRVVDGRGGTVSGGSDGVDHERWTVDAPAGGVLRVSGRWADGWTARVDGRRAPVYRADGIFRAVVVPAGRHTVTFTYTNPDERTGVRLAAFGLLVLVALLFADRVRRDSRPDEDERGG